MQRKSAGNSSRCADEAALHRRRKLGMLIPASVLMTFIAGGVGQLIWARTSPKSEEDIRIPLASGLICGEAILAVVLAVLAALGVNF